MATARARGGRACAALVALVLLLLPLLHDAAALRTSAISAAPEYPHPHPRLAARHAASAAPALPPTAAAPALSPDIMPLLPSPGPDSDGAAAAAPSDVMPTIQSSPSPPNPDALEPDSALAPFGSAPAVAAQSLAPPPPPPSMAWALPVGAGLVAMWLV
ncbi:classical arabinogalactan protein 26-like [Oryza brachyantha]|uniref:classical arabinogalactan protein 26-like n=1 Tax=Oryza brachyantha TaxID=4533 RepID=UPI001ADB09FB|nr:classical arabinogalactan protein 26-like [Oryza brachyantha]